MYETMLAILHIVALATHMWWELQPRFAALLDLESCYRNTSVPIMPPRILPLSHHINQQDKEITNNILLTNQQ